MFYTTILFSFSFFFSFFFLISSEHLIRSRVLCVCLLMSVRLIFFIFLASYSKSSTRPFIILSVHLRLVILTTTVNYSLIFVHFDCKLFRRLNINHHHHHHHHQGVPTARLPLTLSLIIQCQHSVYECKILLPLHSSP